MFSVFQSKIRNINRIRRENTIQKQGFKRKQLGKIVLWLYFENGEFLPTSAKNATYLLFLVWACIHPNSTAFLDFQLKRSDIFPSIQVVSVKSYVYIKVLELGEKKVSHEFVSFGAVVASHRYIECCVAFLLPGLVIVN